MSLKEALLRYKSHNAEQEVQKKIEAMLLEQKALIDPTPEKEGRKNPKEIRQFDVKILEHGGNSHYFFNKKWYRVSVDTGAEGLVHTKFKFHVRTALGHRFFVSAKTYKEAQDVVDSIFGTGYRVSGSLL